MSVRLWSNLQQRKSSPGKSGPLVARGTPSEAPKNVNRTVRPLTYKEIQEMSSEDAAWNLRNNTQSWNAAFEEQEKRQAGKRHLAKSKVDLMWSGHATPEEDEAARQSGALFAERTPTFPRTMEAATLMAEYMKANDLDATRVDSYIKAWRELVEQRKITPLSYQSADAFYHEHKELHPTQKPPLIQTKEARAQATAEAFSKAAENTASAGATHFTDYPERERIGYGNHTRYSFRKLLENLSADEYKKRLIDDKSFSDAVDRLNNGNS